MLYKLESFAVQMCAISAIAYGTVRFGAIRRAVLIAYVRVSFVACRWCEPAGEDRLLGQGEGGGLGAYGGSRNSPHGLARKATPAYRCALAKIVPEIGVAT